MSLTKFDSNFFRGKKASPTMSSFAAYNVGLQPGRFVMSGSLAVQASLGSQLAAKLCLDHFAEAVLECYEGCDRGKDEKDQNILEMAFRRANVSVYNFGHQLAAGGRLAAAIISLVIEGKNIIAGRVGAMGAYLYRKGMVFPFFVSTEAAGTCIGINSRVLVETAAVEAEAFDSVFVFSKMLSSEQELVLAKTLGGIQGRVDFDLEKIVRNLYDDADSLDFAQVICIGPEAVFLKNKIL